jgi:hypothetical protein
MLRSFEAPRLARTKNIVWQVNKEPCWWRGMPVLPMYPSFVLFMSVLQLSCNSKVSLDKFLFQVVLSVPHILYCYYRIHVERIQSISDRRRAFVAFHPTFDGAIELILISWYHFLANINSPIVDMWIISRYHVFVRIYPGGGDKIRCINSEFLGSFVQVWYIYLRIAPAS